MIETTFAHRRRITQTALHLICDGKCSEQRRTIGVRQLGRREHGAKVVRGMAGLMRGQIAVVEIEVSDESAVVERRTIGCAPSAADERAARRPAKNPLTNCLTLRYGPAVEPTDRAPERVENANLELEEPGLGQPRYIRRTANSAICSTIVIPHSAFSDSSKVSGRRSRDNEANVPSVVTEVPAGSQTRRSASS